MKWAQNDFVSLGPSTFKSKTTLCVRIFRLDIILHFAAVEYEQQKSWISELIEALRLLIRGIQMTFFITPLIVTAPIAVYFSSFQEHWFDLLIKTIQRCGPVYIKLGQWASTRRDLFHPKLCHHLAKLQSQAKA